MTEIKELVEQEGILIPPVFHTKLMKQASDDLFLQVDYAYSLIEPDRKRGIEMVINKNANVTVISARYHVANQEQDEDKPKPKLRVAAYFRVSMDSEEQATSYEAQIEHYTEYINNIASVSTELITEWDY